MKIIKITKRENKLLRWLQKAKSQDYDRKNLTKFAFLHDSIVTCDGFRIHAVNKEMAEGTIKEFTGIHDILDIVAPARKIVLDEIIDGKYADIFKSMPGSGREPVFEIKLSPRFLMDLCRHLDNYTGVTFRFYSKIDPVEASGMIDGTPIYAMIMPMRAEEDENFWRPEKQTRSKKEI